MLRNVYYHYINKSIRITKKKQTYEKVELRYTPKIQTPQQVFVCSYRASEP